MSKLLYYAKKQVSSPLYRPAFLRVWSGLMISRVGDQLTTVALIWFVLQLTASGLSIGLIVLCFQLPAALSGPLIGTLLDRYQPAWLMTVDNIGRACIIAMLPLLYLAGVLQLWMIYALALCAGVLSPATEIGLRVIIPRIVPDEELERANSLIAISWDFSTLVGPAVAGFLILFLQAPIVLFLDASTFLVMAIAVRSLPLLQRSNNGPGQSTRPTGNMFGFGSLLRMKTVLVLTILTLLFLFIQGLVEVVIPVYSQKTLNAGPTGYGLLMTVFSVGSLVALALLSQRRMHYRQRGITLALVLLCSGATLAPLIFIHNLSLALIVMGAAGLAAAPYYVVELSVTQSLVPEQVRGQIFGVRSALNVAGYPLGGIVGGVLLNAAGVPFALGSAALLCLTMGAICLLSPGIRQLRQGGSEEKKQTENRSYNT